MNESTHKKKVLITGASGFLGNHLISVLRKGNLFDLVGVVFNSGLKGAHKSIKVLSLDLLKEKSWEVLNNEKPDIVIHCAALLPEGILGLKASTQNRIIDDFFVSFCKHINCVAVYPSGTLVYGFKNRLCEETTPCDGKTEYIKQKIETEKKLLDHHESSFIFRISAPYGPCQKSRTVINIFIDNALKNENINVFGSGKRQQDFTSIEDIVSLITTSIQTDKYGVYNVASGKPISMLNLAFLVKELTNSKSNIIRNQYNDPQELYRANFSIRKAKRCFGWSPAVDLKTGLTNIIESISGGGNENRYSF